MQAQEPLHEARIDPVPDDLESAQAKLVYVYLEATGGATTDELGESLSMKKINVLSVLNSLSSAGYVEQAGSAYVVAN
ncbi:helix-turn-helix domain-containing protein [Natrinema zhouii]|uniref:MarR family transcriptional regulator n=1 Tax=Natrinema zhouii TaxID=1710539 RepID=A0A7D6CTS4_9EURY|nr:MarR family transcriptional regulator [Natrinema zhouii]QLK27813.1 helix-turn-helix domain-containing protein [Natrinema zhouii]